MSVVVGRVASPSSQSPGTVNIASGIQAGDVLIALDAGNYDLSTWANDHLTSLSGCGATWSKLPGGENLPFALWIGVGATADGDISSTGVTLSGSTKRSLAVWHLRGVSPTAIAVQTSAESGGSATSPAQDAGPGQIVIAAGYSATEADAISSLTPATGWVDEDSLNLYNGTRWADTAHRIPTAVESHQSVATRPTYAYVVQVVVGELPTFELDWSETTLGRDFAYPAGAELDYAQKPTGATAALRWPRVTTDGQDVVASLPVTLLTDGVVSFFRHTSTEGSFDYLRFYVDDVQQGLWAGETPWGQVSYNLTAGQHTLKWAYTKDGSAKAGDDTVRIALLSVTNCESVASGTRTRRKVRDFEDGTMPPELASTTWAVSTSGAIGTHSLRSPTVTSDSGSYVATLTIPPLSEPAVVKFDWRKSGEAPDRLIVANGGKNVTYTTAEVESGSQSVIVNPGSEVVTFTYLKDSSVAVAPDAAWVDSIDIPYQLDINDPRDVPGLLAWYSAEGEGGYSDGQSMTQWTDLSGRGNHAVPNGATGPTWRAATGPEGGPAVHFATDNAWSLPDLMTGAASGEIFVQFYAEGGYYNSHWAFGDDAGNSSENHFPYSGTVYEGFGRPADSRLTFPAAGVLDAWGRYNVRSAPGAWEARWNEVVKASTATNTPAWTASPRLGRGRKTGADSTDFLKGRIACVLLFERALTPAERDDVTAWLAANPSGGTAAPAVPSLEVAFAASTTLSMAIQIEDPIAIQFGSTSSLLLTESLEVQFAATSSMQAVIPLDIQDPRDIPGLALWLSAESIVAENGTALTQWRDLSGNDNHGVGEQSLPDRNIEFRTSGGPPPVPGPGQGPWVRMADGGDSGFRLPSGLMDGATAGHVLAVVIPGSATRSGFWNLGAAEAQSRLTDGGEIWDDFGSTTMRHVGPLTTQWITYEVATEPGRWRAWVTPHQGGQPRAFAQDGNTVGWSNSPVIGKSEGVYLYPDTISTAAMLAGGWATVVIYNRVLTDEEQAGLRAWSKENLNGGVIPPDVALGATSTLSMSVQIESPVAVTFSATSGLEAASYVLGDQSGATFAASSSLTVAVVTVLLQDDFDRANSTSVVGNPRVGPAPAVLAGTMGISSNQLYASATTSSPTYHAMVVWDLGTPEVDLSMRRGVTDGGGFILNAVSATNLWYVGFGQEGAQSKLYRLLGTTFMEVAAFPGGAANGSTLRAAYRQGVYSFWIDGDLKFQIEPADPQEGTMHGVRINSTSQRFDDLQAATAIDVPSMPTGPGGVAAWNQTAVGADLPITSAFLYRGRDTKFDDVLGVA